VVNSALLAYILFPLSGMAGAGLLVILWLWRMERRGERATEVQFANPFSISPALKFALLFVVILFVTKAALDFVGTRALYFTAVIAGFTDVDAIALTTARLARESLEASTAAKTIILAAMSNTLMKGGIAFMFGARLFGRQMAMALGVILLAGAVGLLLV
jgi:uncharacterized membrane protein (DUF4010 family)